MTAVATAAWSLDRLVVSLSRGGWGELDGPSNAGLQKVLHALASLLPWEAAEGRLTRAQVADAASMTPKWAGVCLARLEALGLVTWHRGWLDRGRPRAGWIRVHKNRLAELVRDVRGYLDQRRERRKAATQERLATTLRKTSIPPWKRARRLVAPMGTEFHPSHRRSTGATRPGLQTTLPTLPIGEDMPLCAICGRYQHQCERANAKERYAISHRFEPSRVGLHHTVIAADHEIHPSPARKAATSGWRALVAGMTPPAHPTLMDGGDQ